MTDSSPGDNRPVRDIVAIGGLADNDSLWQYLTAKIALSNHGGFWYDGRMKLQPNILLLVNSYQPDRYLGIMRCAKEHGWRVEIESRYAPPRGWHGDGAIINLLKVASLVRFVRSLIQKGIPVVDLSDACPGLGIPRVTEDNRMIGRLAARHFTELGFTRGAFFATEWTRLHRLRYEGYVEEWKGEAPFRLDSGNLHGIDAVPKPIAVFCFNDYNAQIFENECLKRGLRVPEDVAILGVDNNTAICENVPVPISSIVVDFEKASYLGARLLADILEGRRPAETDIQIPPSGIKRRRSSDILTAENPDAARALALIHAHFTEHYGAAQIASELGFSRAKLDRIFASSVGRSVGAEIIRQRIDKAMRLLAETDWTLEAIASETGFCHASYLVKAFRKATGETPHSWRRGHCRLGGGPAQSPPSKVPRG